MERTIQQEKIPSTDKRLARHVNHDSKSKEFAFDTTGLQIVNVTHKRFVPVLNQGNVGSCTGNAAIGCIYTEPFIADEFPVFQPTENGALALYSAAESIDGDGPYPPHDNGSSGLSVAKALKNVGMISGYQHTFTLNDALKALSQYPVITGTNWYSGMDNPDADGRVHPTGTIRGGHEYEAFSVDVDNGRIWFYNSWGKEWGINGTFYMTWADYSTLLSQSGDVTVLIPDHVTPPTPVPSPAPIKANATITRGLDNGVETIGHLVAIRPDGTTFTCSTLELPWLNNKKNKSCIPKGKYTVTMKTFKGEPKYELDSVAGRSGIFMHEGNYYTNTDGCILLGVKPSDINKDGQIDVTSSVNTINSFMSFFASMPFTLTIQ